jgi:hypothetical protein
MHHTYCSFDCSLHLRGTTSIDTIKGGQVPDMNGIVCGAKTPRQDLGSASATRSLQRQQLHGIFKYSMVTSPKTVYVVLALVMTVSSMMPYWVLVTNNHFLFDKPPMSPRTIFSKDVGSVPLI